MSTGRSIHAVPSITPSPREGIEDGPRTKASAEIDVAAVTVEDAQNPSGAAGKRKDRPEAKARSRSND